MAGNLSGLLLNASELTEKDLHKTLGDKLGKILTARQQTVSVAESVTSGQLQMALSLADKALDFFQGGLTAYNMGQKAKHLNIDPIHAIATNCVSEEIAGEMAKNIATSFNSYWGVGITGYASPVPEQDIEELFACFAISKKHKIIRVKTIYAPKQSPLKVRAYYTKVILENFLEILQGE